MHNYKMSTYPRPMVPKGLQYRGARGEGAIAPVVPLKPATDVTASSGELCFTELWHVIAKNSYLN